MRILLLIIVALITASDALAQMRTAPSQSEPRTFVEEIDHGAPGLFLWVSLRDPDGADDLVIYNQRTGVVWLVRNWGPIYGTSLVSPYPLGEAPCVLRLRPGLTSLIASDIDADGRDDLVGHDGRTGLVVRYYQRGLSHDCVS